MPFRIKSIWHKIKWQSISSILEGRLRRSRVPHAPHELIDIRRIQVGYDPVGDAGLGPVAKLIAVQFPGLKGFRSVRISPGEEEVDDVVVFLVDDCRHGP